MSTILSNNDFFPPQTLLAIDMDRVKLLVPFYKRAWYKWKSLKNVPFRKQFFAGYDLKGNTYWEFFPQGTTNIKPRRIWHPYRSQSFLFDYYDKLPIQWLQWLRYSRWKAPTVQELVDDEKRLQRLQKLVKLKGEELEYKKSVADNEIVQNMYKELQKQGHIESGKDDSKTQ
ncbi:DEKNAAC102515 [Brettanomyces naardenensis]|uniref:DEKNAAC102516 n=1 Tax=Brettanomyces naardenensis TaxID=13370 RepID=A0A448YK56_BRENA|nr:DEKNAAC102515 [Brettanomyces naardenensis]